MVHLMIGRASRWRLAIRKIRPNPWITRMSMSPATMIMFALEAENNGFQTKETAPDSGGYAYTFGTSTKLGPLTIMLSQKRPTISWSGGGKLQSKSSLTTGSWQDVVNPSNPFIAQPTNNQTYYRLAQ